MKLTNFGKNFHTITKGWKKYAFGFVIALVASIGVGLACEGTSVTTTCYDAETWSPAGGVMRARVCDNTKCGRAYFDTYDAQSTCTYCNVEPPVIGG